MSFVNRILSWTLKYQYLKDPERCLKSDLTWKSSHFHFTSFFEMWMPFLRPSVMPWGSGLSWWQHLTTHRAETVCSELRDHSIFPQCSLWTTVCELCALILLHLGSDFFFFNVSSSYFKKKIALYVCIYNVAELGGALDLLLCWAQKAPEWCQSSWLGSSWRSHYPNPATCFPLAVTSTPSWGNASRGMGLHSLQVPWRKVAALSLQVEPLDWAFYPAYKAGIFSKDDHRTVQNRSSCLCPSQRLRGRLCNNGKATAIAPCCSLFL